MPSLNVNLVILLSILCSSSAQIFLKLGMNRFAGENTGPLGVILEVAFNPFIILGVCLHLLALATWLYVLKHVDVSYAYPFISLGFVFVLLIGFFFMNENVNLYRLLGTLVIMLGIVLITRSV